MTATTRVGRLIGASVLVITIAACNGAAVGSALPSGSIDVPTASDVASGAASLSAEAEKFRTLSDELVQATEDLNQALAGSPSEDELRQSFTTFAEIAERSGTDLEGMALPTEVQADVDTLRAGLTTLASEFERRAADPSTEDLPPEVQTALTDVTAAVTRIRAALGLPQPTM
jgi:polyhydroxyalkanoate synthesis regulator phasin